MADDTTRPTLESAMMRLRMDDDLMADVQEAISQAHAEAQAYLDGTLYASAQDMADAQDA